MKNGRLKNSITYLFLALFLSMKMVGLHVLSHTDDKDHAIHCTICDHAISNNLTPALAPELQDFTITNTEPIFQNGIIENYHFIISNTIATDQLFSRPPPSLL
ncbi:MAG: hypothetical protein R2814_13240 [Flavobacteriaceae bacterium]